MKSASEVLEASARHATLAGIGAGWIEESLVFDGLWLSLNHKFVNPHAWETGSEANAAVSQDVAYSKPVLQGTGEILKTTSGSYPHFSGMLLGIV